MTTNQLQYHQFVEARRHNVETEAETKRANVAREFETNRSNLANELQRRNELAETHRANVARETEQHRANRANEAIGAEQLAEAVRANMARESLQAGVNAEQARHNRRSEELTAISSQLRSQELNESQRHNKAVETETHRSNIIAENQKNTSLWISGLSALAEYKTDSDRNATNLITGTLRGIGSIIPF